MSSPARLRRVTLAELPALVKRADPVSPKTLAESSAILAEVREGGESALLAVARRLGDLPSGQGGDVPYCIGRDELEAAYRSLPADQRELLDRTAARVRRFAEAQRASVSELTLSVPGGQAGHYLAPVEVAGCYAPGGRFPLPSSVIMTATTARAAGVRTVWVASPRPVAVTKAAAYVAGVDGLLALGGAHAIGAMAYGIGPVPQCDVVVGPGNRWVTAAKQLVSGKVRIDMLAGPSELLVVADRTADPVTVAADLLAQAEHDTDARVVLVSTCADLLPLVEAELERQLAELPTRETATAALKGSFAVLCRDIDEAVQAADAVAPEHLELLLADAPALARRFSHYGGLFVGGAAAEVLGDYGAGPNHTLPTCGTARYTGGLSVFDFLRIRTWLRVDDLPAAQVLVRDAAQLALLEGLVGHSRSAERRAQQQPQQQQQHPVTADKWTPERLRSMFREDFRQLDEYVPVKPVEVLAAEVGVDPARIVKLNANENLYGPHPDVGRWIADRARLHIYPDPDQGAVRRALSRYTGYQADWLLAGAGSDELLDLLVRVLAPAAVATCSPTFLMYRFFARLGGAEVVDVPLGPAPAFEVDVDGLVAAVRHRGVRLVFLATPNNPTGTAVPLGAVERLLAEECVVVLDEAYAEFGASGGFLGLVRSHPNLVVVRTLSKWAGLAGLRVGYMVAHPALVGAAAQIKQPYNINVAAEAAACCSLDDDNLPLLQQRVRLIAAERDRLEVRLADFPWLRPVPSQANFVLCEVVGGRSARSVERELFSRGVVVRCYAGSKYPTLDRYIRVSAGRPADTDRLIEALREVDRGGAADPAAAGEFGRGGAVLSGGALGAPAAVLFDMDGVLAEVSGSYREAVVRTCAHYGVRVVPADVSAVKARGNANNDWVCTRRLVLTARGEPEREDDPAAEPTLAEVARTFDAIYLGLRDAERLIPRRELLADLAARFPMAIVTGRPREEAEYFVRRHNLGPLFRAVVCMEDASPGKPDPAPVRLALQRLGVRARPLPGEYAVLIGDQPDDMRAASAAGGVVPLGLEPSADRNGPVLLRAGAARVLGDLEDLRGMLGVAPGAGGRYGRVERVTSETRVEAEVWLDGTGRATVSTGVGFYDHMLCALAKHGRMDLRVTCRGDTHVDDHHSVEDVALAIGGALFQAVGDKRGIARYGSAYAPLDEALARAVVDVSGRPFAHVELGLRRERIGEVSTEMLGHAIRSMVTEARLSVHVDVLRGENDHHKAEAAFKALALALRQAVGIAVPGSQDVPSTKGVL